MYNKNICFYYTSRRILRINILLYKTIYNKNICFYYTSRRIMTINILLYKKTYNKIFVSVIQDDV